MTYTGKLATIDLVKETTKDSKMQAYILTEQYPVQSTAFNSLAFGLQDDNGEVVVAEFRDGSCYLYDSLTEEQFLAVVTAVHSHISTSGRVSVGSPVARVLSQHRGQRLPD